MIAAAARSGWVVPQALDVLATALEALPRYTEGLLERGLVLMDAGRAAAALVVFEQLAKLKRDDERVMEWLIKAKTVVKRAAEAAGAEAAPPMMLAPGEDEAKLRLEAALQRSYMTSMGLASDEVRKDTAGVDHYTFLGLGVDFSEAQLKRAYKQMSKKHHPDKHGGSNELFQRVAQAYETLRDPERRRLYDEGDDVKRPLKHDGEPASQPAARTNHRLPSHLPPLSLPARLPVPACACLCVHRGAGSEGDSLRTQIEREYYPEKFGFGGRERERERERAVQSFFSAAALTGIALGSYQHARGTCPWHEPETQCRWRPGAEPFGDPFEAKRHHEAEQRRRAPLGPNAEGLPPGTYAGSCHGCAVSGKTLRCSQCLDPMGGRVDSSIQVGQCSAEEEISNVNGKLACVTAPPGLAPVAAASSLVLSSTIVNFASSERWCRWLDPSCRCVNKPPPPPADDEEGAQKHEEL
jgi:curved DNA-binding protein CbpA